MTHFFGSTARPKKVFGEGPLLQTFYDTIWANAPGAEEINQAMLGLWDDNALEHTWVLPDNFHVKIKVTGVVTEMVHFLDEPFEVSHKENMPVTGGRSLCANMVHSIDGMVVREMQRRCNYDASWIQELTKLLDNGAAGRNTHRESDLLVLELWEHFKNTGFLSTRILDYLDIDNLGLVNHKAIQDLIATLPAKPFELISIHDCFRCLPNYGNDLRRQYNTILADIAESDLLSSIVSQICRRVIQIGKLDPNLAQDIRQTNYALS
jgi:hypothetical protein